jgi:putative addiction module CopG family antidote
MNAVSLPPDRARFAEDAAAAGRYRDVSDVIRTAVARLKRAEIEHAALIRTLEAPGAEDHRVGFHDMADVEREMDAIIDAAEQSRA